MQLLYAFINFLILALGLWFVGRKTVLRRFAERRERIGKEGITCVLTYRVVEYAEGMNDMDLYTNGGGRSVQFIIRPKQ